MKRVAVIFESSPFDRKGLFNAVHNRVKGLIGSGRCHVDVYCVQSRDNAFTSKIRHRKLVSKVDDVTIDGVKYHMLWYRFSIVDYMLFDKLSHKPLFFRSFMKHVVAQLSGYDVLVAHSFVGGLIAKEVQQCHGTPYFVTWHGSDIHTHPFKNALQKKETRDIIQKARCNFFVSQALQTASYRIIGDETIAREVIYNGVSDEFVILPEDLRRKLRLNYGLNPDSKVVAFAGNLNHVKNVRVLAPIFKKVQSAYEGDVRFWIIGDGKLREDVLSDMNEADLQKICFWGNLPADGMPYMMNCVDVLVLPSLNEGLPLVCLEAISCGANAVGSAVGGIPEAVGESNVVPLGDDFVDGISQKILQMLNHPENQSVPAQMSWENAASVELGHILSLS